MNRTRSGERGFTLIELMVSATVLLLAMAGLLSLLVHNARINKTQRINMELQSSARNSLAMVVQKLRSAGWDPLNTGLGTVVLDPDDLDADDADGVDDIEILADLTGDGDVDDPNEQVRIVRSGDRLVWRRSPAEPYIVLAAGITNDADGDGVAEPLFTPDRLPDPSRITVRITAESPIPNPTSGRPDRYTVTTDVVLRSAL